MSTEELWKRAGGRDGYRKLTEDRLRQGQEEPLWSRLKWGLVLGGERFAEEARGLIKVNRESTERRALRQRWSWEQMVQAAAKARGEKWEKFAHRHGDAGLGMALYVARRCSGLTLRQLGESAGGMDYSAVAASIKRFEQRLENESGLRVQTQAPLKQI